VTSGEKKGDLSITALYTSQTWAWGGLPCAGLLATPEARVVFRVTNAALFLAGLLRRNLPSLRHSLLHRHVMIDRLLRDSDATQVIELACGLSRRGATFSADPKQRYVEIDLPHVIAKKRELLLRTDVGRAVLDRANLTLAAADVAEASLEEWVEPGARLAVIAEGLLMYLTPDAQRQLWAKVRRLLNVADVAGAKDGLFVFDLVPTCEQPPPGRVGRALEALMKRFTGGRSFERDERTRDDIAGELRAAGFSRVEAKEPRSVAREWALPFADARTQQLLFVCRP
jgi:O-methyltransferase involved in polyketide biosynthesis